MKKRILSSVLALSMLLSLLPVTALAAEGEDVAEENVIVELPMEYMDLGDTLTSADTFGGIGLFTLEEETGKVALKSDGKEYEKWIDRLDLTGADYALPFYNALVEASDNDGTDDWLIDVTKGIDLTPAATEENPAPASQYGVLVTTVTGTASSESEILAEYADVRAEAPLYIRAVFDAFDRDHPEVFWLNGKTIASTGYSYSLSGSVYTYTIKVYFLLKGTVEEEDFDVRDTVTYADVDAIKTAIGTRNTQVDTIINGFTEGTTVAEKIQAFNTYLTTHNEYKTDLGNSGETSTPASWECISALEGRTGTDGPVCEGYSRAFKVLCDKVGIPCVLVNGLAKTSAESVGEAHMWNYVQVDGQWYGMDVTWNDPVPDTESSERTIFSLVGSDTVITAIGSQTFLDSHPVSNTVSTGGVAFTNGPTLNATAYTPAKAAYSGISATISSVVESGGIVVVTATVPSGEIAQYGYSTIDGAAAVTNWQDSNTFTAPTEAGNYYFFARVKESGDHLAGGESASYTYTVYSALSLSYAAPASMTIGTAIANMAPTVSGGTGTYSKYEVTSGSLPTGLTLGASTGVISGTPTAAGEASSVTITVTDSASNTATHTINFPKVDKKANSVTFDSGAVTQFYKDNDGVYYIKDSTRTAISNAAFPATATGGTVTYTYSSNEADYSSTLPSTAGNWTVKASTTGDGTYGPAEKTLSITVTNKAVTALTITSDPTKTEYVVGQNFDSTGMVVKATYNDGTTDDNFTAYTVEGGSDLAPGTTSVTIKADGVTTTQAITVIAKAIQSIAITTAPTKVVYVEGQNFDPAGMIVQATYNDGTKDNNFTGYTIESGSDLTLGTTSVTIQADSLSTTQTITVIAKAITSIAVSGTYKTSYVIGDTADWTGMVITATYNDDSTAELTTEQYTVAGFDSSAAVASQTIIVTETVTTPETNRKSTTFTIGINKKTLTASDFTVTPPAPATYTGASITPAVNCTVTGAGTVTVSYKQESTPVTSPTDAGTYDVYVTVTEGTTYSALSETKVGSFTISKAAPTISVSDKAIVLNAIAENLGATVTPSGLTLTYSSNDTNIGGFVHNRG